MDVAKPRSEFLAGAGEETARATESPASTIKIKMPGEPGRVEAADMSAAAVQAEKRQTSRISLQSVLNDTPVEGGPKTIRLKRPVVAQGAQATQSEVKTLGVEKDSSIATPTQRRTVAIKRSPGAAGARKLAIARPEGAVTEEGSEASAALSGPVDRGPHGVFIAFAALTLVGVLVLIYLFLSQAIGPNSSMTQYSYAPGRPDLVWPGKMSGR